MTNTTGLVQSGTRTFVVGRVSGIDTSALVEIAVQEYTQRADKVDVNIQQNEAKTAAYQEIQNLAKSLQTSMARLQGNGTLFDDTSNSIFDARSGTIGTNDGTNPAGILNVTIDDGAPTGTYDIEIVRQATAHKVRGSSYADPAVDLGHTGSFDIGLAGGATANINVTADMSLDEIASAINTESDNTNVSATVLKVSETDYQLVLTANNTAADIEITSVVGDDVMNLTGISDGVGGFNNVLQTSQTAQIRLDNVLISRDDNDFSDLITGLNITVENESPGTVFTLTVEDDVSSIRSEIESFVETYNQLRTFIVSQGQVSSEGAVSAESVLFSDTLLDTMDLFMTNLISGSSGSGLYTSLREIGIQLGGDLKLSINEPTLLDDALLNNLDEVRSFFSSSMTADNTSFAMLRNDSSQGDLSFALDITIDGSGDVTSASIGGDNSLFTFSGTTITGAEGSIYEGLSFSYSGAINTTVNVSIGQGFGTRLHNLLEAYVQDDGEFDQEIERLESENETLSSEATRIREIAEDVRLREIDRYAKMEAALQANELLVRQIKALFGTDDDD